MPATELGHIISAVFRYSAPISQLLIRKFWVFYYQKVHFSCLFAVFVTKGALFLCQALSKTKSRPFVTKGVPVFLFNVI